MKNSIKIWTLTDFSNAIAQGTEVDWLYNYIKRNQNYLSYHSVNLVGTEGKTVNYVISIVGDEAVGCYYFGVEDEHGNLIEGYPTVGEKDMIEGAYKRAVKKWKEIVFSSDNK